MLKALAATLRAQGRALRDPAQRKGLHPLVLPMADAPSGGVLGLLRWPAPNGGLLVVEAPRDAPHSLLARGTPSHYARRAAVQADASGDASLAELVAAAADLAAEASEPAYEPGAFAASRLKLDQYLLLKVAQGFPDVWEKLARDRLAAGKETEALVAGERAASHNPGWGCCMWLQSTMYAELGRAEERRDSALAALEAPFWTIGAPVAEVQAAAGLEHVPNLKALMRTMEAASREKQGEPPPPPAEAALAEALDLMDEVVRLRGGWDEARPPVADALRRAGLADAAVVAEGGGGLYPWPVG